MQSEAPPLGVYVHWPYCARICPYCDFNVYRNRDIDAERWTAAFARDLDYWREETGPSRLQSLYFGGGTPSLAPVSVIARIVEDCVRLWGFAPGAEITLEANPADAKADRFADLATAGVNRLSLGVQSFDDAALRFLGRDHDGAGAKAAIALAAREFPRVTFDLIYALPGQSQDDVRRTLAEALQFAPTHLSLYQLTIEPGTAFANAVARNAFTPPCDDLAADFYDLAQEMTSAAGLPAYEVSNHAKPGFESRHNLLYWTGGDYVGVGPGAHGRLTAGTARVATEAHKAPEAWLAAVETSGSGASFQAPLDAEARLVEKLAMGLRLAAGVHLTPADLATLGARSMRIDDLAADGLVVFQRSNLSATPAGRRVLNAALGALLA